MTRPLLAVLMLAPGVAWADTPVNAVCDSDGLSFHRYRNYLRCHWAERKFG